MQPIKFSYDVQHVIDAPRAEVFTFLAEVSNIIACSSGVEYTEIIDPRTAKWVLKRKEEFGLSFAPEYTMQYEFTSGDSIAWRTLSGNVVARATLKLSDVAERRTSITVNEEIQFELPISPIMAKIVCTFARIETRNETLQWLRCAAERLERVCA